MNTNEVLKLALDALKRMKRYGNTFGYRSHEQNPYEQVCEAITALEALAEQPAQQEPVAWWIPKAKQFCLPSSDGTRPFAKAWEPLYTSPPAQRKPLTKEQMYELSNKANDDCMRDSDSQAPWSARPWTYHFVRAIEAHYGITGEKK